MRRLIYLAIFFILGWLCFHYLGPGRYQQQHPFSRNAWLHADADQRGSLARDLVQGKYLTPQLTITQVVELLGKPNSQSDKYLYYNVGYMYMNPNWPMAMTYGVSIQFDEAGHFEKAYLHD